MSGLKVGKIPHKLLSEIVFKKLGISDERVLLGPEIGEDGAVIEFGDRVLVLACDPITAAKKSIGWLSVHINANDVASCGAIPRWFLCLIMLPDGSSRGDVEDILNQVDEACRELGVAVIGGHTEVTPGINRPIIAGFMAGEAKKEDYVTTGGARPGDVILVTKGAGIEGTAILASELEEQLSQKVERGVLERAKGFMKEISVVRDVEILLESAEVDSLHDPTEGGLSSGFWEVAEASRVALTVNEEPIPIRDETQRICKALGLNPLNIMSSGSLMAIVKPEGAEEAALALKKEGIEASIVGKVGEGRGAWLVTRGGRAEIKPPKRDEVYEVLERLLEGQSCENSSS